MIPSVTGTIKTNYNTQTFRGKEAFDTVNSDKKRNTTVDASIGAGSAVVLTRGGKALNSVSKCTKEIAKTGDYVVNPKFVKGPITKFLGKTLGKMAGVVGGIFAVLTCATNFSSIYSTGKNLSKKV